MEQELKAAQPRAERLRRLERVPGGNRPSLGCCHDSLDNYAKRFNMFYLKIMNERYFDMTAFRAKLDASVIRRVDAPRRGRPSKLRPDNAGK
jgi:hypothetical protein